MKSGEMKELRANVIWTIIFGIPLSYIRDWLDGYNHQSPSDVADQLATVAWEALRQQNVVN